MERESTVVASKCANVVAGAGSVKSSAGTYTACTDVMEPFFVEVIEWRDEIDTERAEAARVRAEERLRTNQASVDMARAEAALLRAVARIKTKKS